MSLIAILISLLVERYVGALDGIRDFRWFDRLVDNVRTRLPAGVPWRGTVGVLLMVGGPVLVAGAIQYALGETSVLLAFIYAVAVLLYALGPQDLEAQVEAYTDAMERGDTDSAHWYALELLGETPESPAEETRAMTVAVLTGANDRLIAVFFWFVILGPMGALLYRLAVLLHRHMAGEGAMGDAANRLYGILAWPAARLCAFGYALSGRFVEAMYHWRRDALRWPDHNRGVLVSTGFGAIDYDPELPAEDVRVEPVKDALGLARRTVWLWLTVLALMTLSGLAV